MSKDLHVVFAKLNATQLTHLDFDSHLESAAQNLAIVFFWGHQCPNCEIAKASLSQNLDRMLALGLKWFHVNVYEDEELGTRFGLHGIPTFLFFHQRKKLGRISPYPGIEPFVQAIRELEGRIGSPS